MEWLRHRGAKVASASPLAQKCSYETYRSECGSSSYLLTRFASCSRDHRWAKGNAQSLSRDGWSSRGVEANMQSSSPPTLREIEETAARWILKSESPEWTGSGQEAALEEWLQASPSHRVSFLRLQSTWSQLGSLKELARGGPSGAVPSRGTLQAPLHGRSEADRPTED